MSIRARLANDSTRLIAAVAILAVGTQHPAFLTHRRGFAPRTFRRKYIRLLAALPQFRQRPHHIGNDLAALNHDHHIAYADVFLLNLIGVMQAGKSDTVVCENTGSRWAVKLAVLADGDFTSFNRVIASSALNLNAVNQRGAYSIGPAVAVGRSRLPLSPNRRCRSPDHGYAALPSSGSRRSLLRCRRTTECMDSPEIRNDAANPARPSGYQPIQPQLPQGNKRRVAAVCQRTVSDRAA